MKYFAGYKSKHIHGAYRPGKSVCGGCRKPVADIVSEILELKADEAVIHDNMICYTQFSMYETIVHYEVYLAPGVENGRK